MVCTQLYNEVWAGKFDLSVVELSEAMKRRERGCHPLLDGEENRSLLRP